MSSELKIEYGKAWDWVVSLILLIREGERNQTVGYGYVSGILEEYYAPRIKKEIG